MSHRDVIANALERNTFKSILRSEKLLPDIVFLPQIVLANGVMKKLLIVNRLKNVLKEYFKKGVREFYEYYKYM